MKDGIQQATRIGELLDRLS